MRPLLRTWLGLGALGAGIVHLGIAAVSPPVLLAVLSLLGAAELGWGVAALALPVPPRPRLALAGALAPVALWLVSFLLPAEAHGTGRATGESLLPFGAMAGAGALDLLVAVLLAVALRLPAVQQAGEPRPYRFVAGSLAGATLVAVIAANSLAGTELGAGMVMH